jgi:hypothetical protein
LTAAWSSTLGCGAVSVPWGRFDQSVWAAHVCSL